MADTADDTSQAPADPSLNVASPGDTAGGERSASPPPCAICLGNCINKCFSDSCLHQFCFTCLLEWSKVKAVCPLCKQPFKVIIHNVKSNDEYDQHFVLPPAPVQASPDRDLPDWFDPISTSRHFQFRTTLTVDPRGELAIQQLLSTHSLTNSLPQYNTTLSVIRNPHYYFRSRRLREVTTAGHRRLLYERDLWTNPLSLIDVTGRYREVSPTFFRDYPGCKNRLVPFLQRELSALIPHDSIRSTNLVQRIMNAIDNHHVRGRYMRTMLEPDLGTHTEHFIHEFYTFARSPYDLRGYDRHSQAGPEMPEQLTEIDSSDSDVLIVSVDHVPPPRPVIMNEVIEIDSQSSHDSDVVIREPTSPELVDLANTTDDPATDMFNQSSTVPSSSNHIKMPLKVRQKRGKRMPALKKRRRRERGPVRSSSSLSSLSSFGTSTSSDSSSSDYPSRPTIKIKAPPPEATGISSGANAGSSDDETEIRTRRKRLVKRKQRRRFSQTSLPDESDMPPLLMTPTPTPSATVTTTTASSPLYSQNDNETNTRGLDYLYSNIFNGLVMRPPDEAGPSGLNSQVDLKKIFIKPYFSDSD